MSKRHIIRPTLKAFILYIFLLLIFIVTLPGVLIFYIGFKLWSAVKDWALWDFWWYRQKKEGKLLDIFTNNFSQVKEKELTSIKERRSYYKLTEIREDNLSGIAISGGGIRSATLGLGIMQAFISKNVMKLFDYMSTVSGGGYIGSCLSSILSNEKRVTSHFQKRKTLDEEIKLLIKRYENHSFSKEELEILKDSVVQLETDFERKSNLFNLLGKQFNGRTFQIKHIEFLKNQIDQIENHSGEQANFGQEIENRRREIAKIDARIHREQSSSNLNSIDLEAKNSPFTTDNYPPYQSFDETVYDARHQMHHLRTHGQYLTPDKGLGNRDVKRAFGAIWTGILHNIFAFLTVICIIVTLAFTILFSISGGDFFEAVNYQSVNIMADESNLNYVLRVIDNWYENGVSRQIQYISEAAEWHPELCLGFLLFGFMFSMGFLYFAFWNSYLNPNEHTLDRVTSGSSFYNEKEIQWLNFFRLFLYGFVAFTPLLTVGIYYYQNWSSYDDFYWIVFALPFFFSLGLMLGSFLIVPFMEFTKMVWTPLLRNISRIIKNRGNFKKNIWIISKQRNSPAYRSFYSALQGQSMYLLIFSILIPLGILAIFSLRLRGDFLYALLSLGVIYYFFTSKIGGGTDLFTRMIERVKIPLINLTVFLIIGITMSIMTGWILKLHESIDVQTGIEITGNYSNGLQFKKSNNDLNNLSIKYQKDSILLRLYDFDTSRYTLNYRIDTSGSIGYKQDTFASTGIYEASVFLKSDTEALLNTSSETSKLNIRIYREKNQNIPCVSFGLIKITWYSIFLLLSSFSLLFIMGHLTNVNRLSLHYFYRDRLAETYLTTEGRIKRSKSLVQQGMPLKILRDHSDLSLHEINDKNIAPYHLLMAGLNLQGSNDLVRKTMKSEPFLFSKDYVGSPSTGYVKTEEYRGGSTTLSLAMTISGAAISSGMGKLSFAAQSFFMALFNLRTGYWIENPWFYRNQNSYREVESKAWKIWKKPFWMKYLLFEMIGQTNAQSAFINVADGGFTGDNLGLLPLIQRQCRYIVVCDFEQDEDYDFEAFNHACRIANIDFNTKIEISLEDLIPREEDNTHLKISPTSVVTGRIHYPNQNKGALIYIKSSLSRFKEHESGLSELPVNVFNYKKGKSQFPHESTADQFFNDVQFEAYRALGEHLGNQAIQQIKKWEKNLNSKDSKPQKEK